jgi:sodium transport system permease protein
MTTTWHVFVKELVDALRDRRTLLMVLLSSVAVGPFVLFVLSTFVADLEKRAEAREVLVVGLASAPTLINHLERQTFVVKEAPADWEARLGRSKLGQPVLVVPEDFEAALAEARVPRVEVVASAADQRSASGVNRLVRAVESFGREQAALRLAVRGVAPVVLQPVRVEERDLADPATRAAQFSAVVPFFVLMAVVYGALTASLDTTAGERERGSLEPLLMNPASRWALVIGKWGAVAAVAMLIAVLSAASFVPAQWLLRSESLAALFQFGWFEAAWFIVLLVPFGATAAALLMAIAIRCRTFKEAQANSTIAVLVVSMLPLFTFLNQDGAAPWHGWVPALSQTALMGRVLKGEALAAGDVAAMLVSSVLLTAVALAYVQRCLKRATHL